MHEVLASARDPHDPVERDRENRQSGGVCSTPVLVGRHAEQATIDRLLDAVRHGEGGGLVLRGESGIGKSALLAYAEARAGDLRVLRATAVEAESELAFAALHQLALAILDRVEALPAPQRGALRTAFGLAGDCRPDRFLVSVAMLTLLSETADDRPLLCLVDDAHWADAPSLDALTFVARRIGADPIGLVLAMREGDPRDVAPTGLREVGLTGLHVNAAAALLDGRRERLDPAVRERVLASAGGNPLALLELPAALAVREPGRPPPLGEPLPLTQELERAFLARVRELSPAAQAVLLIAAAQGAGEVRTLERAAEQLGLDPVLAGSQPLAELLRVDGSRVGFRHPLVRSALYHGAAPGELRSAHRALAEALAGDAAGADRRAWHLALAADGADEAVAEELERSAERALRRSGHAAAAAAFERAAELSPADEPRARRLVAGALESWHAGRAEQARVLLDRAERLAPRDAGARLDLQFLRGSMELRAGVPADGLALLLPAARAAARVDPGRALRMQLAAREAAFHAAEPRASDEVGAIVATLPAPADPDEALVASVLAGIGDPGTSADAARTCARIARAREPEDPVLLQALGGMAWGLGDLPLARRLRMRAAARARALGAAGTLAWALEYVVFDELAAGAYATAEAHADEGRRLAVEAQRPNVACSHTAYLAEIVALRGREDEARALAEGVLAEAAGRRLVKAACDANRALGRLALAAGRPEEALVHLEALWGSGPSPGGPVYGVASIPDQIEATLRARLPERRPPPLAAYEAWVESVGSPELRALAARCRACWRPRTRPSDTSRRRCACMRLARTRSSTPVPSCSTASGCAASDGAWTRALTCGRRSPSSSGWARRCGRRGPATSCAPAARPPAPAIRARSTR